MKRMNPASCLVLCALFGGIVVLLGVGPVYAGDASENWRSTYDQIMLFVNFLILASLLYIYGRKPITNFLRSQQDDISDNIGKLEEEKAKILAEIEKTRKALADSDAYFAELKARFVRDGERKRQEIIDQAQRQSEFLMDAAKRKIQNQILVAQKSFKDELVDAAFDLATAKLAKEITVADNEKLLHAYMAGTTAK